MVVWLRNLAMAWLLLAVTAGAAFAQSAATRSFDVVVYGSTSGGITAAVQAARMGKHVALVSPTKHVGGLSSGGLGWTDVGNPAVVGGLSREFYHGIFSFYENESAWKSGTPKDEFFAKASGQRTKAVDVPGQVMWVFEPHAAEQVFNDLLREAKVELTLNARLDLKNGVTKENNRITAMRTEDGTTYAAKIFIDATYEGDLMARAGVSYFVGREANSVYKETVNGIQAKLARKNQLPPGTDPYVVKGDPNSGLLPGVNANSGGEDGAHDPRIQAYCYRMCLTDVPANRVAVEKPAGYDEKNYELLFRVIEAGQKDGFFKLDIMPNRKTDSNNGSGISTDFIGMNYKYPEADYAERAGILAAHEQWQRGLIWSLQNHPRVPEAIRKAYAKWGLCKDEFADNNFWPYQLYIREARRMKGLATATEHELMGTAPVNRPIGMGVYAIDSHAVQRYIDETGHVRNEGDVQIKLAKPYSVDYGCIVPKADECENLIVPICLSASHVAYGSIRIEPVFMVLGQSAGTAAAIAIDRNVSVQSVPYDALHERLIADKQILAH
ncbi:MAG: hypothetical protein JWM57_4029 [Phycisphaerales bacterium]|nr:hypothetical protein [Phycisphaerales bacterium]